MSNRLKPKIIVPQTREAAEALVGEIAELKIFEAQTKLLMDMRLQEVRQEYELQLAGVASDLVVPLLRIQAWADSNPDQFGENKSIEMLHGTIGWRMGNPTVKPLSGFTWKSVLARLKAIGRDSFIRGKEEVNKEAILIAKNNLLDGDLKLLDGDLKEMGVRIVQEESFFVCPKSTPTEQRMTV